MNNLINKHLHKLPVIVGLLAVIAILATGSGQVQAEGVVYPMTDMSKCVSLSWDATPGADDYRIVAGQDRTAMTATAETASTSLTCAEAGVTGFGQWYVRVRARNAAGMGDFAELPFVLERIALPGPVENLRLEAAPQ